MSLVYCIIMAGGSGSRLWPVSRELFPKQMFKLDGDYTLFQRTFLNIATFVDDKNIIPVTNIKYVSALREQLKQLKEKFCRKNDYKILSEPIGKNTAPCITMGVKYIKDISKNRLDEPIVVCVPSDQLVTDRIQFSELLSKGVNLAEEGYIVSFGTKTDEINPNLGYIKTRKNPKISQIEPLAQKVIKFVEKPDTKNKRDVLTGKFYMNSGIYMFSVSTYFNELKKYCPQIYDIINKQIVTSEIPSIPLDVFNNMPEISIDYAVMEKTKKLACIPLNSIWKDAGSWNVIYDISQKDKNGNCFLGNTVDIDSSNTFVYSTSKLTATMGLKDAVVVETEDAVLVSNRDNINNIKKIYKKLSGKNASKKEIHKTVFRPWGYYTVLESGNGFLTKSITVNPNAKLSVQKHFHRSEHWIILEGEASVLKGNEYYHLNSGESIDIDIEEVHSLQNNGKEQLVVLEIQQGDILDENDIVRIEDIYGRV